MHPALLSPAPNRVIVRLSVLAAVEYGMENQGPLWACPSLLMGSEMQPLYLYGESATWRYLKSDSSPLSYGLKIHL
jgi:hypothetical protein